jgi:hypothetical protein
VGHAGVAIDGVGAQQEDLWNDRSLAQSADRRRASYVYLDGIVLKRSWAGEVPYVSLLVAIGVKSEGYREILAICKGAKEDKAGWSAFLKHLKGRGLCGIRLIISDACMGPSESAAEFLPEVGEEVPLPLWPLCGCRPCIVGMAWWAFDGDLWARIGLKRAIRRTKRKEGGCQPLQVDGGGGQILLNTHVCETAPDSACEAMPGFRLAMESF